jgi:hypothetical protein
MEYQAKYVRASTSIAMKMKNKNKTLQGEIKGVKSGTRFCSDSQKRTFFLASKILRT